jgi:hypothetical protein
MSSKPRQAAKAKLEGPALETRLEALEHRLAALHVAPREDLVEVEASNQLIQSCRSAIVNPIDHWPPIDHSSNDEVFTDLQDHQNGPFGVMVKTWVDRVEYAALHGLQYFLVVQFKHSPKMNLVPILARLYDSGVTVLAATVEESDFVLILQKSECAAKQLKLLAGIIIRTTPFYHHVRGSRVLR